MSFWPNCDSAKILGVDAGKSDACTGDDGGPLVCNDGNGKAVITGVVSRLGPACADPNYPGVYSNVSHVLGWIKNNMVIPPFYILLFYSHILIIVNPQKMQCALN